MYCHRGLIRGHIFLVPSYVTTHRLILLISVEEVVDIYSEVEVQGFSRLVIVRDNSMQIFDFLLWFPYACEFGVDVYLLII
jgi:hypothetical protein